jgi:hypothetical protein
MSRKTAEIGPNRESGRRPKSAAPSRPKSRRLRHGRFFGLTLAGAKLRTKREARGVKIEIAPVYVDMRASARRYTLGSVIVVRDAGMERVKSTNVR